MQPSLSESQLCDFNRRFDALVDEGVLANPLQKEFEAANMKRRPKKQSSPKNLLDRLNDHKSAVLAFMNDFKMPFDNNLAERDIRMMKV